MITVQAILDTRLQCFFLILQTIKIDMVNLLYHFALLKKIFIYDGKCRASYNILYTFCIAKRMNESGFTRTHTSMKSKNPFIRSGGPKLCSCFFYFVELIYYIHAANISAAFATACIR